MHQQCSHRSGKSLEKYFFLKVREKLGNFAILVNMFITNHVYGDVSFLQITLGKKVGGLDGCRAVWRPLERYFLLTLVWENHNLVKKKSVKSQVISDLFCINPDQITWPSCMK